MGGLGCRRHYGATGRPCLPRSACHDVFNQQKPHFSGASRVEVSILEGVLWVGTSVHRRVHHQCISCITRQLPALSLELELLV
jgi:hypothetical protein